MTNHGGVMRVRIRKTVPTSIPARVQAPGVRVMGLKCGRCSSGPIIETDGVRECLACGNAHQVSSCAPAVA